MKKKEEKLNELALFAGAGGGVLGGMLCGFRTVCAVEIEPYAIGVLMQRQNDGILPTFPIWDDIRTFDGRPWRGIVDVVSGGFPCQAWSTASRGRHTAINMWPEMLRVIGEVEPRYIIAENVDEGAIIQAQADLSAAGYSTHRGMFSAAHVGADHPRERWWMVADADNQGKLGLNINAEMAVEQTRRKSFWEAEPRYERVPNGVAHRVDRLKAIGNGQVPAVVRLAWETLTCQK